MPITVIYPQEGDQRFRIQHGAAFEQWLNQTPTPIVLDEQNIEFDRAEVRGELHSTKSRWDPNPENHITVRLSNAELRGQNIWYTLHYRPNGGSTVAPEPETEDAMAKKREHKKRKKERQRANKKERRDQGGPGGGSGAPVAEPGTGPSQAAETVV